MRVLIVGAGPAGLLLANTLLRRPGYEVRIVERNSDPRGLPPESLHSYPIALQARGLEALKEIPRLEETIVQQGIWPKGVAFYQGAKARKLPVNPPKLFVDHDHMTFTLLEELIKADKSRERSSSSSLCIDFDTSLDSVDLDQKTVSVQKNDKRAAKSISFDQLVAADGCRSKVRQEIEKLGELHVEKKDIPDVFRLISLARQSDDGSLITDSDYLNGWILEDGKVRVIAAPLHDGCLSGAFVFDKDNDPLATKESLQDILSYFEEVAPGSLGKLVTPELAEKLLAQSTTSLVTVNCDRLHVRNCVLLLGDAAHAMSQAVGHGCISALQDVQVFRNLLDKHEDDWRKALPEYTKIRLSDAHALNVMSDSAVPTHKWMKIEWGIRQMLKKMLPSWLGRFMRPLPVELLSDTTLSYSVVREQSQWWLDRVKGAQSYETEQKSKQKADKFEAESTDSVRGPRKGGVL